MNDLLNAEVTLATMADADEAHTILKEAALRLIEKGDEMWTMDNISFAYLHPKIEKKELYLLKLDGKAVGTIFFQLEDPIYWPEKTHKDAGYLHRLALRNGYTGRSLSARMIEWAMEHARQNQLEYLRLDVQVFRPRLCALYEGLGFERYDEIDMKEYRSVRYEKRVSKRY